MAQTDNFFDLVAKGEIEQVRSYLAEDPGLASSRNGAGSTALQWAAYHGQTSVIDELLKAQPDIDIWTASTIGIPDKVSPTSAVNELSEDGFTPLGLAVAFHNNGIARFIIENGADVNLPSKALGGVPPLQSAVFGKNLEGVILLLDAGANVNATQGGDFTALMGAAQNGDVKMVGLLLERGANPKYANCQKKTAYDVASNDEVRGLLQPDSQDR